MFHSIQIILGVRGGSGDTCPTSTYALLFKSSSGSILFTSIRVPIVMDVRNEWLSGIHDPGSPISFCHFNPSKNNLSN